MDLLLMRKVFLLIRNPWGIRSEGNPDTGDMIGARVRIMYINRLAAIRLVI